MFSESRERVHWEQMGLVNLLMFSSGTLSTVDINVNKLSKNYFILIKLLDIMMNY